ncbi:MAG: hypothetical protein JWN53_839, partial [Gemmatimonadetes bacterium]|nr:hypothetical protein [Gemmatimonadota bacterium]
PAVSPDGRFVALTIRKPDLPSELVVWRTADEPDTLAERRRAEQRKRDPEDEPDRNFYPPPTKPVISLIAESGAPYESPRWLADNKHLLVTRRMPLSDGTVRSDLYLWSAEDGELRRLTHGAGVRDPDPAPDGKWAAAVRCDQGWCDLVRVDLTTGAIHVLRAGTVAKNYYRPRVSPRTSEIAVSEQAGDRWRVARVSPVTGLLRYADPNDGVTRYDATWAADGASLVVTSHSTGIPNLERIDTTHAVTRLSSVTGAAVAPDVAPDGAIWFLSFHGTGFDLRRIAAESPGVAPGLPAAIALADSFPPVLPPRLLRHPFDSTARPTHAIASPETDYGFGPSRFRYLPGATSGFGGTSTQLAIVRSDPVGRFGASLLGVLGDGALPEGLALTLTSRMWRTELSAVAWSSHAEPSRQLAAAGPAGLDLVRRGGAFVLERSSVGVSGRVGGSLALLSERQNAAGFDPFARDALVALLTTTQRQRDQELRYEETVTALGEAGSTQGGKYGRQRLFGMFGAASRGNPLATLQLAYGRVGGGSGREREQFVIGGIASPLIDPMFDARRVEMPAYPAGSIVADGFVSYRAGIPFQQLELFYSGVTTDLFVTSLRSFGAELRQQLPAIPALATPEVDGVAGIARAVDEPVKGAWRVYLTLQVRP